MTRRIGRGWAMLALATVLGGGVAVPAIGQDPKFKAPVGSASSIASADGAAASPLEALPRTGNWDQPSPAVIETMIDQEVARLVGTKELSLSRQALTRMVVGRLAAERSHSGESRDPGAIIAAVDRVVREVVMEQELHSRLRAPVRPSSSSAMPQSISAIPAGERAALIDLYNSTTGAGWIDRTNWRNVGDTDFNAPGTECTWYGVICDGGQTTVQQLTLWTNNLVGTIPASLGSLANLQYLYLYSNQLTGTVPPELGSLTNLQYLNLSSNQLTGTIPPELGSLTNLQYLFLYSNQLTGSIPNSLGNLTNLHILALSSNQLTGTIPPELGSLTNLTWLLLSSNQLTGTIPTELGHLTSLQQLNLSSNQLAGSIPPELGSLTNLQYLYLFFNQLTGSIPPELGNLTNLLGLHLWHNQLTGTIPPELGSLTNLQDLDLSGNSLTGTIPTELGTLPALRYLLLQGNQLTGTIPVELGSLTNLQYLFLGTNQLTGTIPTSLGSLTNLQDLNLSGNSLTGSVPTSLGSLTNLTRLNLGYNQLTGTIPASLGSLTNLQVLSLGYNQLAGTIPPELGALTNLRSLDLSSNQLTGAIPPELGGLTNLEWIYLGYNQLTGSIPPELGSLTNLRYLVLYSNQLTGSIPSELGSLTSLQRLYLSSNQLTGTVPSSITNLAALVAGLSDFRWNGLYSSDPAVVAFLNLKQVFGNWQSTQTVPVTGLAAGVATTSSVALTWTPITYTGDTGGYQVFFSTASGGPWTLSGTTPDKTATGWTVTGLNSGTPYYFIVKSVTNPHANNLNTVVSDPSAEVSQSTVALEMLTVSKAGTGTGAVASSPVGIDCGATCSAVFEHGTVVTLTPTADVSSTFTGWSGACTGSGACVVTMDAAKSVTATFTLKSYLLTVSKAGTGTGTVTSNPVGINCGATCSASFDHGTAVTLTPTADASSTFAGWSGACTGTGACVVTMDAAKSVTATFTLRTYLLTVSKAGTGTGTVTSNPVGINCGPTCSASFTHGTAVTLTQVASAGSTFTGWTGACAGTGACVVTMNAAKSVTATFTLIPIVLTASGTPDTGPVPLGVAFTASAIGGVPGYTWAWDFGDSTSSTLQNPSHTYTTVGIFSAVCTVTDSASHTTSKTITVTAHAVPTAAGLDVDIHQLGPSQSDLNGVFEPGETVIVEPSWTNPGSVGFVLTGDASAFTGPSQANLVLVDGHADYGLIGASSTASCYGATGDCFALEVTPPITRPATHWDATFTETLSTSTLKTWTLHIGDSFTDVPRAHWAYRFVETMLHEGITSGCGAALYCPDNTLTRAEMAVLLLMAEHGPAWTPPLSTGLVFTDVPIDHWAGDFIETLAAEGITSGCGSGLYCPDNPITRAEMAVFLLAAEHGSSWTPPLSTGLVFTDVPIDHWAGDFIEALAAEGITGGCGTGLYCPDSAVTRAEMAVFLTATFNLKPY